jgi:hypothetical protein
LATGVPGERSKDYGAESWARRFETVHVVATVRPVAAKSVLGNRALQRRWCTKNLFP